MSEVHWFPDGSRAEQSASRGALHLYNPGAAIPFDSTIRREGESVQEAAERWLAARPDGTEWMNDRDPWENE